MPAALSMLLQQSINGGYAVITQAAVSGGSPINPWLFALLRDIGASALLLVAAACYTNGGKGFFLERCHVRRLFMIGFCGIWGSQLLGAIVIKYVGAVVFASMQPAQPAVTFVICVMMRMEPLSLLPKSGGDHAAASWLISGWLKVGGLLLTVSGAVVMVLRTSASASTSAAASEKSSSTQSDSGSVDTTRVHELEHALGFALLFVQIVLGACYGILQKSVLAHYSAIVVCAWGYSAGCLLIMGTIALSVPLIAVFPRAVSVIPDVASPGFWHVPTTALLPLLYSIIVMSAIGYSIMSWVNQRVSPFFVTSFYPFSAIAAEFLAFLFLGEGIDWHVWLSTALVALGLYCVLFAKRREAELLAKGMDYTSAYTPQVMGNAQE